MPSARFFFAVQNFHPPCPSLLQPSMSCPQAPAPAQVSSTHSTWEGQRAAGERGPCPNVSPSSSVLSITRGHRWYIIDVEEIICLLCWCSVLPSSARFERTGSHWLSWRGILGVQSARVGKCRKHFPCSVSAHDRLASVLDWWKTYPQCGQMYPVR